MKTTNLKNDGNEAGAMLTIMFLTSIIITFLGLYFFKII